MRRHQKIKGRDPAIIAGDQLLLLAPRFHWPRPAVGTLCIMNGQKS